MKGQDVILGILLDGPMSGYDIKQYFEKYLPDMFVASFGTIYPTLNRMEKEGYIEKEIIVQEGKPNKHLYRVTTQGKEAFHAYIQSPIEPKTIKYDFMMRLVFGKHASEGQILNWLHQELAQLKSDLEKLKGLEQEPCLCHGEDLALRLGLAIQQAGVTELETIIAEFASAPEPPDTIDTDADIRKGTSC
ncbi:PadR family transcriptional regulator [Heliobacterium gestii]|uniref:PadR family transcriptional regulator n=1 Tax=Heliomicrobium gestii TaxID=2699 RepID=A0A845LHJ1_HELGE|nr:PadR family transcriptional regulator [Heliomicrobium gestii]MBM7866274.1 DNA-binding PadR family transcriptional regulator [Heliomicrobium gestii]MZP42933.1 PadR family transcriptional regulator [Heliomicrobium gestii]